MDTVNRFTDAEMDIVRNTDLPSLLTALGYQVTKIGRYHSTKEMDSLRIKNRTVWYRYSENIGGDAIAFLRHFCGMNFRESVEYLLRFNGQARAPPQKSVFTQNTVEKEKIPFALPPKSVDHRRVFAYLRKRGVAAQVISAFLASGLLYEDAEHHNCVFVGRKDGQPVFANKRGTYDRDGKGFKGDVSGSDKSVGFRLPCSSQNTAVRVFEAPIDLMSYCTLHRQMNSNAVALCCLHDGALKTYLAEHPHLNHIILCLDADEWGRRAAQKIKTDYESKGFTVDVEIPEHGKDWNELLQQRICCAERGR